MTGSARRELRRVCVFCGSSPGARPAYRDAAEVVGRTLAERGIELVYGGASVGLMGAVADAALAAGGTVIGVLPALLADIEIGHAGLSELHVTGGMAERKQVMADLSDGFLALPGGLGTLEELFEMVVLSQLAVHHKPVGLVDVAGYWDHLLAFLDHAVAERLLSAANRELVLHADVGRLADLLDRFTTFDPDTGGKWLPG